MSKKAEQQGLRRFPKILADELDAALRGVKGLGSETTMELLRRLRSNRSKCIAVWGISDIEAPVPNVEPIPLEYFWQIEQLDKAFQKLHEYNNGGAGDYVAKDVERAINSYRASGKPRNRDTVWPEILKFVQKRSYAQSDNKKKIRLDAAEYFGVSERTVYRAIEEDGRLARPKQKSTDT